MGSNLWDPTWGSNLWDPAVRLMKKNIQIYTCGYKDLGFEQMPWKMSKRVLHETLERHAKKRLNGDVCVHTAYTVTSASDPQRSHDVNNLNKHWGEHPDIMERVMKSDAFVCLMNKFKQEIVHGQREWWPEGGILHVWIICKNGRHRAVAAAKLLTYLAKQEGFVVRNTVHLSRYGPRPWDDTKQRGNWLCTNCDECGPLSVLRKEKIRKECIELWDNM